MKTIFALLSTLWFAAGCATTYPNKTPTGKVFPSVQAKALNEKQWNVPQDMAGKPVVLLVAYKQDTQFDVDRWLIGLDQTQTQVAVYELPTIQGLFPRMFKGSINEGMRKGIPKPLWKGVITIYGDGAKVQKFTGNENPLNTRAILLDKEGVIRFFHDRGFSVPALNQLREELAKLK